MKVSPLNFLFWFVCVGLKLTVCVSASLPANRRKWPSVAVLFGFGSLRSVVLMLLLGPRFFTAYFNVFWVGTFIDDALLFWVIRDVWRALPCSQLIPTRFKSMAIVAVLAMGVVLLVTGVHNHPESPWAEAQLQMQRCVDLAWVAAFLVMQAGVSALGFAWPKPTLNVISIFLLQALLSAAGSELRAAWHSQIRTIDLVETLLYLPTLLCLVHLFNRPRPQPRAVSGSTSSFFEKAA